MNWWKSLDLIWKVVLATAGGITGIAGGVVALRGVWKDLVEWRDSAVFEFLRGREKVARAISLPGHVVTEPTTVTFMAKCLRRKPQRVISSLMRLERKDQVHQEPGGWRFGPTPQRPTLPELERWR